MPGSQAVPPLLGDYLAPLTGSLTLITGTVGATTSWLIVRYLASLSNETADLHPRASAGGRRLDDDKVVTLVSWLNDPPFWRESGRKLPINFQKINAFSYLNEVMPTSLSILANKIESSVMSASSPANTVLILDGIDFVLASCSHSMQDILGLISSLRQAFRRVIVTVQADASLLHAQDTPLEVSHAALVMSLAHQADVVISLRELETGAANDVSGILRATGGGQGISVNTTECLYFVGVDGMARVFGKGT